MIRTFVESDMASCLAIFDGNCPKYFDPSERADYEKFLNTQAVAHGYLVIEEKGKVVAAGGIAINEETKSGWFCWGLVDTSLHGMGLGSQLVEARLDQARLNRSVACVHMDTSQKTVKFYERFGFVTEKITQDGYGAGLDRYDMTLKL